MIYKAKSYYRTRGRVLLKGEGYNANKKINKLYTLLFMDKKIAIY